MDILDIDEALKDDSYIFLADKTHDDISNILQQWKTNNQQQQQQSQTLPSVQQLQYNNEQAYKLNSKTFTRPKRRLLAAQNLDTQFTQLALSQNVTPMLNLEIGGLVTNMHKSFLQDTSPPSSICSSMHTNERMNNSLISSADFSNLNFLQSTTQSLEPDFNLTTTLTPDGYTYGDMIRDRKALEALSMSGDGALIKDTHICQIDDISLTLSKTASGCSTMDNSTDSISTSNNECNKRGNRGTMHLSEQEMIGDMTFNLVDSMSTTPITEAAETPSVANATFKKPNETMLLAARAVNTTYTETCDTPETRCETPENLNKLAALCYESTPMIGGVRQPYNNNNNNNKQPYTPTLKGRVDEDVNISPIVSATPQKSMRLLNNTYEPAPTVLPAAAAATTGISTSFDGNKFVMDTMELLEQIEQPLDGTYNMGDKTQQEQSDLLAQHKQMQCVMDLAEAEVELLAQQGDEDQFEHMLAELGKVNALNADQLKMQKSLDSIKRRFKNNCTAGSNEAEQQLNVTLDLKTSKDSNVCSPVWSSNSNSNNSSASGGERLLSRRSRLYDDVNLSAMQASSNGSGASCNSTSFIVHRRDDQQPPSTQANVEEAIEPAVAETEAASYKLAERRERDRERFKTIKITKEMRFEQQQEIIVPCIDDDNDVCSVENVPVPEQQQQQQRLSRRERSESANNYLTYKKPKEKTALSRRQQLPEVHSAEPRSLSRPRYISGLQKFTTVSKATSAGAGLNATAVGTCAVSNAQVSTSGELKSPMGIKSKSFHNLSSNMSAGAPAPRASLGGLRRPAQSKFTSGLRVASNHEELPQSEANVFKVPKLVSGLRAPASAPKRAVGNGLARPSSGYYSLSVAAKEPETPESLSSASSRGSLYGSKDAKTTNGSSGSSFDTQALSSRLTQVTTGATGIPKPSGLRQPTQMKRSALPRPNSIVRR